MHPLGLWPIHCPFCGLTGVSGGSSPQNPPPLKYPLSCRSLSTIGAVRRGRGADAFLPETACPCPGEGLWVIFPGLIFVKLFFFVSNFHAARMSRRKCNESAAPAEENCLTSQPGAAPKGLEFKPSGAHEVREIVASQLRKRLPATDPPSADAAVCFRCKGWPSPSYDAGVRADRCRTSGGGGTWGLAVWVLCAFWSFLDPLRSGFAGVSFAPYMCMLCSFAPS